MKINLSDRMKKYEDSFRFYIPSRLPTIIRIDGRSFGNYTKHCEKPIDLNLVNVMNETAKYLCKNIQGARLAYVQSDEISLLLNSYESLDSSSWFDNNLQKMCSISASLASAYFTQLSDTIFGSAKIATFDSRVFVLPKEEANNYFLWRQQDCTRNSVQMLARSIYSHKACENKNNSELQEMIFQSGQNWNDCPTFQKRGRCVIKTVSLKDAVNPKTGNVITAERSEWTVDNEIPIFSQNKEYIEKHL